MKNVLDIVFNVLPLLHMHLYLQESINVLLSRNMISVIDSIREGLNNDDVYYHICKKKKKKEYYFALLKLKVHL